MNTTHHEDKYCPVCAYRFDCTSCLTEDAKPRPKDISLCINCGEILQFTDDMGLVVASSKTLDELLPEERQAIENVRKTIQIRHN